MKWINAAVVMVVLAATTVWAQSIQPSTAGVGTPVPFRGTRTFGSRGAMSPKAGANGVQSMTPHQRLEDMEGTLTSMRTLLKQMHAKAASSSKDPLIKANLEMWELLVAHLDKQLLDLRVGVAARDQLEARRAAMYKHADEKAAAAAQAAQNASAAGQALTTAPTGSVGAPNPAAPAAAAQAPAAQTAPTPPASSTSSPN